MLKRLMERLRGARRFEYFAALALAALLALMLLRTNLEDGDPATPLERRVERILGRIEGAGRVSAMIVQGDDGAVMGALIVAAEVEDLQTYLRLQRAVSALLDVEPERIEIIAGGALFGGGA